MPPSGHLPHNYNYYFPCPIAEELLKRLTNQVDFYFKLYDKDESGALSRQELVHLNKARTEL